MKKNNKSGFILIETITLSVVILVALVGIYVQFSYVTKAFYQTFQYNSVNNLYLVNNIKLFLNRDNIINIKTMLNDRDYVDITNCDSNIINEYAYCQTLFSSLNANKVIVTHKNLDNFKQNLDKTDLNDNLKKFIKSLNTNETTGYRLIVELNDQQFVTLDMGDM